MGVENLEEVRTELLNDPLGRLLSYTLVGVGEVPDQGRAACW
jgi:hypothetical protein